MAPRPGLSATVSLQVTDDDTASAFHSGDVEVLATPRVVALAEEASVQGDRRLAREGHAPRWATACSSTTSPPPSRAPPCRPRPRSSRWRGRRLTFRVSVTDHHGGLVAAGRITRVSVERKRFMEKAAGA